MDAGVVGDGVLHHYVFLFLSGCGTDFAAWGAVVYETCEEISAGFSAVAGRALDSAGVCAGLRHVQCERESYAQGSAAGAEPGHFRHASSAGRDHGCWIWLRRPIWAAARLGER